MKAWAVWLRLPISLADSPAWREFGWKRTVPELDAQAVLRSRRLVEEFVKRNDLMKELRPIAGDPPSLWFAVNAFRDRVLSIVDDDDRGTTTIEMKWTDPKLTARWANEFVALANQLIRTRALDESSRNIKYLNDQIAKTNVVEIQRVMYNLIENETKTHMLANGRQEYAFTVVDPAVVPERRIWPRRTLMVLTGGVLGVILGVILALAHDVWSRYRTRESKISSESRPRNGIAAQARSKIGSGIVCPSLLVAGSPMASPGSTP